ncbi:MAG: ArsC/Spx/MgsR family protein, partial [Verrucomicrobiota bacterium]
ALVKGLEDPVEDLVRKDSVFKKMDLVPEDYEGNPEAVVQLLAQKKALFQRPVVAKGDRSIIGRPKGRIAEFLSEA